MSEERWIRSHYFARVPEEAVAEMRLRLVEQSVPVWDDGTGEVLRCWEDRNCREQPAVPCELCG